MAQKGIAGGLYCLQVDGNDLIAVLEAFQRARAHVAGGNGASVIEFVTYRLSDHTTADDARRYRSSEDLQDAWTREPILRMRTYLTESGHWNAAEEQRWIAECEKRIDHEIDRYLRTEPQPRQAMFDHLYAQLPPALQAQRAAVMETSQS